MLSPTPQQKTRVTISSAILHGRNLSVARVATPPPHEPWAWRYGRTCDPVRGRAA